MKKFVSTDSKRFIALPIKSHKWYKRRLFHMYLHNMRHCQIFLVLSFVTIINAQDETAGLPRPQHAPFGHVYNDGRRQTGHNDPIDDLDEIPRVPVQVPGKYNLSEVEQLPLMFDLPSMLQRNIAASLKKNKLFNRFKTTTTMRPMRPLPSMRMDEEKKKKYFGKTFGIKNEATEKTKGENSTSCDEFGKRASFHPLDIVEIDWIPFYVWSSTPVTYAVKHKFSVPTKRLVAWYRDHYGPYLDKPVNWDQPKLHLHGTLRMLLIAVDYTGLFYAIPRHQIPDSFKIESFKIPILTLRLKIEDPYLVMMYCDEHLYATVMAVSGQVPPAEERAEEAATVGFRAEGIGVVVERDVKREQMLEEEWKEKKVEPMMQYHKEYGMFGPGEEERNM